MKRTALILSIGSALLLFGCNQAPSGGGSKVADLEKQITAMQDRDRDVRVKMRLVQSFPTRSPLAEFFASPEFWQCTYDSSWSDCSSRCATAAATHRATCAAMTDETKRLACYQEASDNVANCVKNCPVQMSPTSPPNCGGGIM